MDGRENAKTHSWNKPNDNMKNMLIKHEGMWNLKLGNMIGEVVHELMIHILHG
jgi:hypothetical protein